MRSLQQPVTVTLSRDRFLRIVRPLGVRVHAERGTVWVTIDGEADDLLLEAGESREFGASAPMLVGALGAQAVATLSRRPAAAQAARWWPAGWPRRVGAA